MLNCSEHNNTIHFICIDNICDKKGIACDTCLSQYHDRHHVKILNKGQEPLNCLNKNKKQRDAHELYRNTHQLVLQIKNQIDISDAICKQVCAYRNVLEHNILNKLKILVDTFSDNEIDLIWNTLMHPNQKEEKLNAQKQMLIIKQVIEKYEFLLQQKFQDPCNVIKGVKAISKNLLGGLQKLNKEVQNSFNKLKSTNIIDCFDKFELFSEDSVNITQSDGQIIHGKTGQKMLVGSQNSGFRVYRESQQFKSFLHDQKAVLQTEQNCNQSQQSEQDLKQKNQLLNYYCKKMASQIFGIEEYESKQFDRKKSSSKKQSQKQSEAMDKNIQDKSNKNVKIEISKTSLKLVPKLGVVITQQLIKQALSKCPQSLENIYIAGLNDFTPQCLERVCNSFSALRRLSYIYRIEADAIKLQMRQTFQEQVYTFREEALPVTQKIFNLYSKLPLLQNMLIGNISDFQNIQIKNKQIKYLTLGNFIQDKVMDIPHSLQLQIKSKFTKLQKLSLFNIQNIPETFISIIFQQNPELKHLWMSQCKNVEQRIFKEFQNTNLEVLILDLMEINGVLCLPLTLKSLIIDNCSNIKKIQGIKSMKNLKNFSITQSKIESQNNIAGQFLSQLTVGCKQTLQYLNFGNQKDLNDQNSVMIAQFSNLKYLSISYTEIKMAAFIKHKWPENSKIEKLDIIIPAISFTEISVVEIGRLFPELTHLICSFRKQMTLQSFQHYNKLKVLKLKISKRTKNMNQFKQFREQMSKKGIKIGVLSD